MSEEIAHIKKKLEELEDRIAKIEGLLSAKPREIVKKMSIKEFILPKQPRNDTQRALVIGYYLEKYEGFASFNAKDLEKGFRDAREAVPPNVSDKIQMNIAKGHIMEAGEEKDGLKAFVLTNSGERFVEDGFGKE